MLDTVILIGGLIAIGVVALILWHALEAEKFETRPTSGAGAPATGDADFTVITAATVSSFSDTSSSCSSDSSSSCSSSSDA